MRNRGKYIKDLERKLTIEWKSLKEKIKKKKTSIIKEQSKIDSKIKD